MYVSLVLNVLSLRWLGTKGRGSPPSKRRRRKTRTEKVANPSRREVLKQVGSSNLSSSNLINCNSDQGASARAVVRRRPAVAARLVLTAHPFVAVLPTSVLTGDCYFLTFSLVHRTFAMFVSLELSLISVF